MTAARHLGAFLAASIPRASDTNGDRAARVLLALEAFEEQVRAEYAQVPISPMQSLHVGCGEWGTESIDWGGERRGR